MASFWVFPQPPSTVILVSPVLPTITLEVEELTSLQDYAMQLLVSLGRQSAQPFLSARLASFPVFTMQRHLEPLTWPVQRPNPSFGLPRAPDPLCLSPCNALVDSAGLLIVHANAAGFNSASSNKSKMLDYLFQLSR